MAATHFQIFALPDTSKIVSKIGTDPLLEGVLYDISMESTLNFKRVLDVENFYVLEKMLFKTYDQTNDIWSNMATATIIWKAEEGTLPTATNTDITIDNSDTVKISDAIQISEAVEVIKIHKITNVDQYYIKNEKVLQSQVIKAQELPDMEFRGLGTGNGEPYSKLEYVIGTFDDIHNPGKTVYSIDINSSSYARLIIKGAPVKYDYEDDFDVSGTMTTYDVTEYSATTVIEDGYSNGAAKFRIILATDYLGANPWNKVTINVLGEINTLTADGLYDFEIPLNVIGGQEIKLDVLIVKDVINTYSGTVEVKLMEINSNSVLVSPTENTVTITTNS